MKQTIILFLTTMLCSFSGMSQSNNLMMESKIKQTVLAFENAASERDLNMLERILHHDYRVIANKFKGISGTTIISKELYLKMMQEEKIGGTKYETNIIQISITDHTSFVEVYYTSATSSDMHKYLFLVQNENDEWRIISDLPVVIE